MQRVKRWKLLFSSSLAVLILAAAAQADDKGSVSREESIHQSLRSIIDRGADLYNKQGDWNGCYRLWEGALLSLRPVVGSRPIRSWAKPVDVNNAAYMEALKGLQSQLGERPDLRDVIDTGLTAARQVPQLHRRAFVLRVVLDQVRAETKPAGAAKESKKPAETVKANKTLWDRLGGEAGATKIVDDFFNLAAAPNSKIDFFRGGKYKMSAEQIAKMKREFVKKLSQASGGPLKYSGPDMRTIHKGMGISDAQFDAATAVLKKALAGNKVAEEDAKKVIDAVIGYRKDIVEPKKPAEKKPEGKKSTEKKPEGKKPTEKNLEKKSG